MSDLKCLWDAKAILGEGPLWDAANQCLYWVDIIKSLLHRYSLNDNDKKSWYLPGNISSFAPHHEVGFIATFRDGVYQLDLESGKLQKICDPEPGMSDNRMNDGCCDTRGNFWFGSMDSRCTKPEGKFYCLDKNGKCKSWMKNIIVTNGPTFTADGRYGYFTDTTACKIFRATIVNETDVVDMDTFYKFSCNEGVPDGMCVDIEDHLWVAHWGGFRVSRISPDGIVVSKIDIPSPNVTKCVFGGRDMKTLFITTARVDVNDESLEKYPQAGGLFCVETNVAGFNYPPYAGPSYIK